MILLDPAAECSPKHLHSMAPPATALNAPVPHFEAVRRLGRELQAHVGGDSAQHLGGLQPLPCPPAGRRGQIIWMCWQMWQQRAVCCKPFMQPATQQL